LICSYFELFLLFMRHMKFFHEEKKLIQ